jgi:hypothetical protein
VSDDVAYFGFLENINMVLDMAFEIEITEIKAVSFGCVLKLINERSRNDYF